MTFLLLLLYGNRDYALNAITDQKMDECQKKDMAVPPNLVFYIMLFYYDLCAGLYLERSCIEMI